MINTVAWLPAEALNPAQFERAMSALVSEWGNYWFAKAKPACRSRLRETGSISSDRMAWRRWGEECSASLDEAGQLTLAEAMLNRVIAANAVQPADRPILKDMTRQCIDDLIGRLSWLIDRDRAPVIEDGDAPCQPGVCWDIGLKRSGVTFSLVVHHSALIRWRKALAAPAEKPKLASVSKALLGQPVRVELRLGQGSLNLTELEDLGQGDVIVLDRLVDRPVEMMAAGRSIGIAGKLMSDEQALRLQIVEKKKVSK